MFEYNQQLTSLELENFAPAALDSMHCMFYRDTFLESIKLVNLNTQTVTNFSNMLYENSALTNLDINFDFRSATTTSYLFKGCTALENINIVDTNDAPSLTNASYMYEDCVALTSLGVIADYPMSSVTNFSGFVKGCKGLIDVELATNARPTNISHMFNNGDFNSITMPNLDTTATTNFSYAFANNPNITAYNLGDNFLTSAATNLGYMFYNSKLANFDLNRIDTSKVTTMEGLFYNCKLKVEDFDIIRTWDTSKVTNMSNLFRGAFDGEEFSLAGLNLSSVTSVDNMLSDNPNLKSINVDGVNFGNLSMSNILTLLTPNTIEKVDLSHIDKTETLVYNPGYSAGYYFGGRTNLKELIIPNINFQLQNDCYIFNDSPLEIMSVGIITPHYYSSASSSSYWYYHSYLCSGRKKLRSFSTKELKFFSAYS